MGIQNIKNTENKLKLFVSILKISLLCVIIIGVPLYLIFFQRDFLASFKNIEEIVAFLKKYQQESMIIYVLAQIAQVVISIIPGQVFQMAAGYLYGFGVALFLSMLGAALGTAISFGLAKLLGKDFLHIFFGEEKMTQYVEKLNSKRAYTIVFFIYLIPGIPKDMMSYAAGVSEINFKIFMMLSVLGRLPGMLGSMLIGFFLDKHNYWGVGIVAAVAAIAFLLCIIFRKRINAVLDKAYEKIKI